MKVDWYFRENKTSCDDLELPSMYCSFIGYTAITAGTGNMPHYMCLSRVCYKVFPSLYGKLKHLNNSLITLKVC